VSQATKALLVVRTGPKVANPVVAARCYRQFVEPDRDVRFRHRAIWQDERPLDLLRFQVLDQFGEGSLRYDACRNGEATVKLIGRKYHRLSGRVRASVLHRFSEIRWRHRLVPFG
jgi:hypothetical protein